MPQATLQPSRYSLEIIFPQRPPSDIFDAPSMLWPHLLHVFYSGIEQSVQTCIGTRGEARSFLMLRQQC